MKIPFVFGQPATEENFTGRSKETQQIVQNCLSHTNTIIISPEGWGKTSLVKKVSGECLKYEQNIKFCFLSLKNIRNEEEFYNTVAKEFLRIASPEFEKIEELAKKYLGKLFLKIKLISGRTIDFALLLDMEETIKCPEEIFNLAESIAKECGLKIIVCIDEFQNISGFLDTLAFQQKLRSSLQNQINVVYCIYGSDRKILSNIFQTPEKPLYRFGEIIHLKKIKNEEWIPFLTGRFANTGKSIDKNSAEFIVKMADNHPQYIQILGQQAWLRSPYICNEKIIGDALESIILQNSLLYQNITGKLSPTQLSFLNALISGTEKFNSQKVLLKYKLGTSGNIAKIKKALTDKEIIDIQSDQICFLDPFYKMWLAKYYFSV